MTTPRKADANRRIAGRSTGPQSPEGKAMISKSATCHGVLSALAVVSAREHDSLISRDFWGAVHRSTLAPRATTTGFRAPMSI